LPEGKYEEEVRVLASIARSVIDDNGRVLLLQANGLGEALGVLTANAKAMTMRIGSRSPPALADL
jgi:hypothetical protein